MGALVDCYISRRRLEKMTGLSLAREEDILRAFESVRFDIEEIAENSLRNKSLQKMEPSTSDFSSFSQSSGTCAKLC